MTPSQFLGTRTSGFLSSLTYFFYIILTITIDVVAFVYFYGVEDAHVIARLSGSTEY
jgi:hypothetical protein